MLKTRKKTTFLIGDYKIQVVLRLEYFNIVEGVSYETLAALNSKIIAFEKTYDLEDLENDTVQKNLQCN